MLDFVNLARDLDEARSLASHSHSQTTPLERGTFSRPARNDKTETVVDYWNSSKVFHGRKDETIERPRSPIDRFREYQLYQLTVWYQQTYDSCRFEL